ncbi:MAG TPA: hypothetical protein PKI20_07900 [Verrucomicrobiota bacterium]|jgi:hypothetical protein|nr:hypothetical protein [Verrucomicrobiota bacterium]HQL77543.1 hypothetical protein [Verrucomicrobiota bacterium]
MKVLPWICVVGLLAGLGWVYSAGQKKDAALAALREENQQLQAQRAEQEEAANVRGQAENDELIRLRRDHEELLRLRNEARQLRAEREQLGTQVRAAQAQAMGAQEQIQALRASAAQPPPPAPGAGAAPPNPEQNQAMLCMNNLRMIHAIKAQWALQQQKAAGALLTAADIAPQFPNRAVPACPSGGVYTLNPVGIAPVCNIPGHSLPR